MIRNSLRRLSLLSLAVLASGVATLTASAQANADWWRRQQQQQQQQRQMEIDRQRRQQQDAERQRLRDQERQRLRDQERTRMRDEERSRLIQEQRRKIANDNVQRRQAANDNVRRRQGANDNAPRRAGVGGGAAAVSRANDRTLYSNGVAKLNRAPTPGELRRGFTGKVTQDGRALVKVNNRVLAVPVSRVGGRLSGVGGGLQTARLSAAKGAAVTAEVQKIARASLKNTAPLKGTFNKAAAGDGNGGGGSSAGGNSGGGGGKGGAGGGRRPPKNPGDLTPIFNDAARKPPTIPGKVDKPTLDHNPPWKPKPKNPNGPKSPKL
jgi:hypothetical protein